MRHRRAVQKTAPTPTSQLELPNYNGRTCIPIGINFFQHVLDARESMLVEYCLFSFLPSQYHQAADGRPTVDLSYLRYLCLESHLLLNAVSACAMVASNSAMVMDRSHESSHILYMSVISEISAGIAQGTLSGTEDSLLATVIWLCVYEVRPTNFLFWLFIADDYIELESRGATTEFHSCCGTAPNTTVT